MSLSTKIPDSTGLETSESFSYLFKKGMEMVRQLSGRVWTDHNFHDPGVTILENLCYALTEATLKARLDVKDIVTSGTAPAHNGLYAASEILPCSPVTVEDYRKVLIDTPGVKNGWILPVPYNEANDIDGLYDVLLELEDDETLGDLNTSILVREVTIDYGGGDVRSYTLEFSFPFWDEEIVEVFQQDIAIDSITSPSLPGIILTSTDPSDDTDYFANLEVTYNTTETVEFGINVKVSPVIGSDPVENAAVEAEIVALLSEAPGGGPMDQSLLKEFNRKVTRANVIKTDVVALLQANRNLCEDVISIRAVRIQEIAVQANIKVLDKLHIERYLANLYYVLDNFFNPDITAASFDELKENGAAVESVFEGPLLGNGFITDESLNGQYNANEGFNGEIVFVSDISHIIIDAAVYGAMDTRAAADKLVALETVSISNYIRNRVVVKGAKNCLALAKPELYKPRFSINKSRIVFYRDDVAIEYNPSLTASLLDELNDAGAATTLPPLALEIPQGDALEIGEYTSIQYDFPATYGLAGNRPPETVPSLQRAQVEQLRSYLAGFDQVLASYSNQIVHVNLLFSLDENLENTYFKQALYEIPHLRHILLDFLNSAVTWDAFMLDLNNTYQLLLSRIMESTDVFLDRRNRFLDHVMARFGFSLARLSAYKLGEETKQAGDIAELEKRQQEIFRSLIADKCYVLQHYPDLSANRFHAYNYADTPWDSTNTSGLHRRLVTLMGLRNINRRTLHDEAGNFIQVIPSGPTFTFTIVDSSATVILQSETDYPTAQDAEESALETIKQGVKRDNIVLDEQIVGPDTFYQVGIRHETPVPGSFIAINPTLFDENMARRELRRVMSELREIGGGLHIVEHVLLRPDPEQVTVDLEIPAGDPPVPLADPYSFRISIVLPSGYRRDMVLDTDPENHYPAYFRDDRFRKFAENLIREEVPAHIVPHIFWLDFNTAADNPDTPSLQNFEGRWKDWTEARANPLTPPATLNNLRNDLVAVMNAMFQLS